jgi:predicted ATPase/class 3 adenylate cyclase/Tfp pilus assembly protein PilF
MMEFRALLLTDVVDSTKLSEALGDAAMAELWAAHDRVARDLLPVWRGREIDKTDGLLLMFEEAADAVGYAIAYHRALALLSVPLKARAGVHVGAVLLRENPASDVARGAKPLEVEGIAKPVAARVMALAQGGQTLLTVEARAALGPTSLRLVSHGHWRVKGIAEPFEVFEVGGTAAPFTPPPAIGSKGYRVTLNDDHWLPVARVRHSLPAERDAFVGRRDALLELARRFAGGARLVSVVGMGGSGKTRLVTRYAWTWLGDFPGGGWFCDLSAARSVDGVVRAVADAFDVPLGKDSPVAQLGNVIAARGACLVILDNFEQVSRYAEETLGRWLDRAGEARFLVTSREVLGLPGEEALPLPPLPLADAAALFVRRAESAQADFRPNAQDQAAIAPLVKLLDGLPLAIELAAARVRGLPPRVLLARMSERFSLLASSGGRHDRQATLRAAFDWSWDLLLPAERAALAQLSVFEGGFTLEAAEAILDLSVFGAAPWPTDVVHSLVDKSFVRRLGDGRFDLLVSMQEYAAEHLRTPEHFVGSGPQAMAAAQARHAAYFAALGEQRAVAGGCVEVDNLVVACRRAAAAGQADTAAGALEGAWAALKLRGPFNAGVELALSVRAMSRLTLVAIASVERIAGSALQASGRVAEAQAHLEAALNASREARDQRCEARVLNELGDLYRNEGRVDEARTHLTLALTLARACADRMVECAALNGLGSVNIATGHFDAGRRDYEAALGLAREMGDRQWEGGILGNLATANAELGRMDEARADYEAGLAAAHEAGDKHWEGNTLCNLGLLHFEQGRMDDALEQLDAALDVARAIGHKRLECIVVCNLGLVHEAQGRHDDARAGYEAALAVARALTDRRSEGQVLGYLGRLHARQGRLNEARRSLDAGEALLREVSDRVSLGILLCSRAEAEHLGGAQPAARTAQAEAWALATQARAGPESELGVCLARVNALLGGHAMS